MNIRVTSGTKNTKITLSTVSQRKTFHLVAFLFEENYNIVLYNTVCEWEHRKRSLVTIRGIEEQLIRIVYVWVEEGCLSWKVESRNIGWTLCQTFSESLKGYCNKIFVFRFCATTSFGYNISAHQGFQICWNISGVFCICIRCPVYLPPKSQFELFRLGIFWYMNLRVIMYISWSNPCSMLWINVIVKFLSRS